MVQFNLLPDVKLAYVKSKRQKRLLVSVAMIVSVVCVAIMLLLFSYVQFAQKKHINDLTRDIENGIADIQSIEDIDKILTVQNQLASLPELQRNEPYMSRLFTYIQQTTPSNVAINRLDIDVAASTMTVAGTAASIADINVYADTLKFATYKTETVETGKPFTNIVTTLARDQQTASFTIDMIFDPIIFSNTEKVTLTVPEIVTTRSETEKPDSLFEEAPTQGEGEGN